MRGLTDTDAANGAESARPLSYEHPFVYVAGRNVQKEKLPSAGDLICTYITKGTFGSHVSKSAEMWFRREFQVASKTDKKPFSSRLSVLCESGQVWLS